MAQSDAERARKYREKKKKRETAASLTTEGVFKTPFYTYMQEIGAGTDFDLCLEAAGIDPPSFTDDGGPAAHQTGAVNFDDFEEYSEATGSLARAEVMIDHLIGAARDLAEHVNWFKHNEIKARLAELEASDLSDPATKKAALQEAARLNKMQEALNKQIRMTFPQWKVTG